jgi:hypothetical protein
MFMRVNSKCAHQVRPPLSRDSEGISRGRPPQPHSVDRDMLVGLIPVSVFHSMWRLGRAERASHELPNLVEAARTRGAHEGFQLANASSIGLNCGLQGGRKRSEAPAPSIAVRTSGCLLIAWS